MIGLFKSLSLPLDALLVGLVVQVHSGLLLGVPEMGLLDEGGHVEFGGVGDLLGHQGFLGHELALQVLDAGGQAARHELVSCRRSLLGSPLDDPVLAVVDRSLQVLVVEPMDGCLSPGPRPLRELLPLGGCLLSLLFPI